MNLCKFLITMQKLYYNTTLLEVQHILRGLQVLNNRLSEQIY